MVVLNEQVSPEFESDRTIDFVAELSLKHDVLVSTIFISKADYPYSPISLLWNVRREGVRV